MEGTELEHIFAFTKKIVRAAYVDSHFVEYFPWIRHLPSLFLPWKREAINDSLHYSKLFTTLYNDKKMRLVGFTTKPSICFALIFFQFQGDERPSFAVSVINKQQKHELSDKQAIYMACCDRVSDSEISLPGDAYLKICLELLHLRRCVEFDSLSSRPQD